MDKSKQHWLKVQERKRKEAEKKIAESEAFIKMMDSLKSDIYNIYGIPIISETKCMRKEGEQK